MTLVDVSTSPGAPQPTLPAVDVEVAFTGVPGDAPSWRSIATGIVTSLHVNRGRSNELEQFRTGQGSVVVSNRNSWFTPWNTSSPFYGLLRPGLRMRLVARWSGIPRTIFEGYLDGFPQTYGSGLDATVVISGGDVFKRLAAVDLPDSLYEMVVGIDRPSHWWRLDEADGVRSYDAGNEAPVTSLDIGVVDRGGADGVPFDGGRKACLFTNNEFIRFPAYPIAARFSVEVWFSSTNTATVDTPWQISTPQFTGFTFNATGAGTVSFWEFLAPHVTVTNLGLFNGAMHQLVAVVDSTGTYLYVDGALVSSNVNNDWFDAGGGTYQTILGNDPGNGLQFGFTGALANLSIYNNRSLSASQVADHYHAGADALVGETTGARLNRLLDFCEVPAADRDIDAGNSLVGAHDLSGGKALDYLQTLGKTEQGRTFASASNKVTHRARHTIAASITDPTPPFTFDDRAVSGMPYEDIGIAFDEDQIRNPVTVTRAGGAPQLAVDAVARDRNGGAHGYELSGLLYASDNESFDCAAWIVSHYKDADERIDAIVLRPQSFATYWAALLALEFGTRIRVLRHPPGGATTLTKDLTVEGITHSYDREAGWTIVLALSPTDLVQYWVLDDPTYSVLDATTRVGF